MNMADEDVYIRRPILNILQLISGLSSCVSYLYYCTQVKLAVAHKLDRYGDYIERNLFVFAVLIGFPFIVFGFLLVIKKTFEDSSGLHSLGLLVNGVGFALYFIIGGFIGAFFTNPDLSLTAKFTGALCVFTSSLFLVDFISNPLIQSCITAACCHSSDQSTAKSTP